MKFYIVILSLVLVSCQMGPVTTPTTTTTTTEIIKSTQETNGLNVCLSDDEMKLYKLIMAYRKEKGLPSIPLSASLSFVAQTHCKDMYKNKPDLSDQCNAHSWSDKGNWTSCCYTSDHKQANCMWNKPKELTKYTGTGFEISYGSSKMPEFNMTPEYAINGWKKSNGHNNVIINESIWKNYKWNAIGIGMHHGFATVWFGKDKDTEPVPTKCK